MQSPASSANCMDTGQIMRHAFMPLNAYSTDGRGSLYVFLVQKVVDHCGPQVKVEPSRRRRPASLDEDAADHCEKKTSMSSNFRQFSRAVLPSGVDERLNNMEVHLDMYKGNLW